MLLAIETSTRGGSVALLDGEVVVAYRELSPGSAPDRAEATTPGRGTAGAMLAPAVASIGELDLSRVEVFALSIGPGSFTGLRIGLAFVKGLALVYPRPVVGVSTLELIAARTFDAHPEASLALPLIDARRREVYAALYRRGPEHPVEEGGLAEGAYPVSELGPKVRALGLDRAGLYAAGDGVSLAHGEPLPWSVADPDAGSVDARLLGRLAAARFARGEVSEAISLEPKYLQLAPAEQA